MISPSNSNYKFFIISYGKEVKKRTKKKNLKGTHVFRIVHKLKVL